MTAVRSGIPTTYRKARFRSRLEARWASFFDLIGWRWTYEPLDVDGYVPDFLIHGERPFFVEVGPCILQSDYEAKAAKPTATVANLGHDVLVVGVTPLADLYADGQAIGWLGEYFVVSGDVHGEDSRSPEPVLSWGPGRLFECVACRTLGVVHDDWTLRPCAHYDAGRLLGAVDPYRIDALWNHAGSQTQWQPWRR